MSEVGFSIPKALENSYFFSQQNVMINKDDINCVEPFFAYEILYYSNKLPKPYPWENQMESILSVIALWEEEKLLLAELYARRSKEIRGSMKKGIALFYMLIFWSNDRPVQLTDDINVMKGWKLKAVNLEERLAFVRKNPHLYHSFAQLSELFIEQHKLCAKKQALQKGKKKDVYPKG
jgi:hypothetical protein